MNRPDLLGCVVFTMLAGCGGATPQVCSPGATQACVCQTGGSGAQSCNAAGEAWEACACEQAHTQVAPPTTTPSATPAPINQTHPGRLEQGDEILAIDNSIYDRYEFEAAEGMMITVVMQSTEFDSYLHLLDNEENMLIQNDDRAPGSLDAALQFRANRTGRYIVFANAQSQGMQGAYTLTITTAAPGQ